ncbi:Uu.00g113790.m01.CDS01 [Anthostomella pinea]|uniref:Uu.00g113790.m01.CDS01 n=1 Tax=Anthostomella pinea TaxID=933095 RepID=A0AAI8VGG9_9PEZI|nr:Uu.00g113790.m01.CDS01 [Anthostomella pinea]
MDQDQPLWSKRATAALATRADVDLAADHLAKRHEEFEKTGTLKLDSGLKITTAGCQPVDKEELPDYDNDKVRAALKRLGDKAARMKEREFSVSDETSEDYGVTLGPDAVTLTATLSSRADAPEMSKRDWIIILRSAYLTAMRTANGGKGSEIVKFDFEWSKRWTGIFKPRKSFSVSLKMTKAGPTAT